MSVRLALLLGGVSLLLAGYGLLGLAQAAGDGR